MKLEFRISVSIDRPLPSYVDPTTFTSDAAGQILGLLRRRWPALGWALKEVPPSDGPVPIALSTPDPRFDPNLPVTVNGFPYAPMRVVSPVEHIGPDVRVDFRPDAGADLYGEPTQTASGDLAPGWSAKYRDPIAYPPRTTSDCWPPRREGDEYVCATSGCGLRWGVDEERPGCPL